MGLPTSGTITIKNIIDEFSCDPNLRACAEAAGLPLTNIKMSDFYGLSSTWLLATLDNPNPFGESWRDYFGYSVAISGDKCIVGAYQETDSGKIGSGKAYVFNTSGTLLATLNNPNAYGSSERDNFGYSVAISGNYCIVGAYKEDDSGGNSSGKAYIFNTSGTLLKTLNNPNKYGTSAGDSFGSSVAISGNYCIVGAYLEDDSGGNESGKAYIFNTSGTLLKTLNNPKK